MYFSLLLEPINKILEGWRPVPLLQLLYVIPILKLVCQKFYIYFQSNKEEKSV
jgi:hypothetical protein